jgi:hypothetical protein
MWALPDAIEGVWVSLAPASRVMTGLLSGEVKSQPRLQLCEVPSGTGRSPNRYPGMSPHHMKTFAIALIVATVGLPLASAGWVAAAMLTF